MIPFFVDGEHVGSLTAEWPESPEGNVIISCPCGVATGILPLTARRMCIQDGSQIHWESANVSECQTLNFDLCNISQEMSFIEVIGQVSNIICDLSNPGVIRDELVS